MTDFKESDVVILERMGSWHVKIVGLNYLQSNLNWAQARALGEELARRYKSSLYEVYIEKNGILNEGATVTRKVSVALNDGSLLLSDIEVIV